MKKILFMAILAIFPTTIFAGEYGYITSVKPVYKNHYVTRYKTECYDVKIPIYKRVRNGSDSDVVLGAIIGGAIGHELGGDNKDALTVLGAVIGANEASVSKHKQIVGYEIEQQCNRTSYRVNEPIISHYDIEYKYNGREYQQETRKHYNVGQRVKINTSIH